MTIRQTDTVLLVHGLGGSRLDMKRLAKRPARVGFAISNWGYWSLGTRIETHASRLVERFLVSGKFSMSRQASESVENAIFEFKVPIPSNANP